MSEPEDGGPAFPWGEHGVRLGGMSLRDYFAAEAMGHALYESLNQEEDYNCAAQRAYEFADAMLKARSS